jgi:hypothetical protein
LSFFDVVGIECNGLNLYLQIIKDCFAEFVREKRFDAVEICTDDGDVVVLRVKLKRDPYRTTLGLNWDNFCDFKNIKEGDVVRFKFGPDNRCYFFKLT